MNLLKRIWGYITEFFDTFIPYLWGISLMGIITMVVLVVFTALIKLFLMMLGVA